MNIVHKTLAATALGGLLAAPAFAGGYTAPVVEAPVAAPAAAPVRANGDWTGAYLGGQLGYGNGSYGSPDGDGAVYGVQGGYDWDLGQWVVGVGLDWTKADIDLGNTGDGFDQIGRLKLKGGYDLGNTLVYATGGLARAKADIGGSSESDNGWFAGVGAEYKLRGNWTLGGEVLYNQFDDFNNTGTDLDATTAAMTVGFRF